MKKKIILAVLLIGLIVGGWAVWYVFYKPHADYGAMKPEFTLTTAALSQEFKANTDAATKKYIDKPIMVDGAVTAINGVTLSFDNVACNVDSVDLGKLTNIKVGDNVKLQGRVTGYNDLLEEIGLSQCVIK